MNYQELKRWGRKADYGFLKVVSRRGRGTWPDHPPRKLVVPYFPLSNMAKAIDIPKVLTIVSAGIGFDVVCHFAIFYWTRKEGEQGRGRR
jgi:hypothetical protein